ncbi:MAG: hypothetical protein H0Z33_09650 [Bacillaceae bacterium]|nr:hypothetical protein [Bacillaceae bacterium]
MSERHLLASFRSVDHAIQAERALQNEGFHEVQVDRVSPYPGEGTQELRNPITGNISSLADLTLDADITNKSAGILTAADVSASGMADGFNMDQGNEQDAGRNILLTVVTSQKRAEEAENIIKKYGGEI